MASAFANRLHRVTRQLNLPQQIISPKAEDRLCASKNLLISNTFLYPCAPGTFALLPNAVRSLEKLQKLIDRELQSIGAQKVILPNLVDAALLRKSGRWEMMESDLLKLRDRHNQTYCLAPTHEEVITTLIGSYKLSHKHLPIMLYQSTMKYRDEQNPRYGLLRCREFLMKDLYSFDSDVTSSERTYDNVCSAYGRIFSSLGVRYVKASGDTGMMGGSASHEYHIPAACGEDRVLLCTKCGTASNAELNEKKTSTTGTNACQNPSCGRPTEQIAAIEVGHCFRLGTRYSAALSARFVDHEQKFRPFEMGCYGIGVTRLLAACVEQANEATKTKNPTDVRLPLCIAPYRFCIVTPKRGSKEQFTEAELEAMLHATFGACRTEFLDDVLLDDRDTETIGMRVRDARRIGIPYLIVIGKKTRETMPSDIKEVGRATVELIDVHANKSDVVTLEQLSASLPRLFA